MEGGNDAFKTEVNAWKKSVGNTGSDHLIELLTTWHQNGSYYLLFPWADGNLHDFWKEHPEPSHIPTVVQWMAQQCLGIMEGLYRIHRSDSSDCEEFGIHGDIKPENILWFKDRGTGHGRLVICDFGFTKFHNRKSRSNAAPAGMSGTYRAPEIDRSIKISRGYDIWTVGCLYLEFVTWYLTGWNGITLFMAKRINDDIPQEGDATHYDKFFNYTDEEGAFVKAAVLKVSLNQLYDFPHTK